MRKSLTQAVAHLPRPLRRRSYLSHLRFRSSEISALLFKLAETRSEREQAFRVLHDMYLRRGLIDPAESGLRCNVFSVLPSTALFVGMRETEVLSTMSLIEDSALGLPMEDLYSREITRLRSKRRRLAEVGALAVARGYRGKGLALMMYNLMFRWAHFYRGVDDLVIAVNPRVADFYETILFFERIGEERIYASLKDAPAVALRLDLRTAVGKYRRAYDGKGGAKEASSPVANLYRFFLFDEYPNLQLPRGAGEVRLSPPPAWDASDVRELLERQRMKPEALSAAERRVLFAAYPELARGHSRPGRPRPRRRERILFVGEAVTLAHVARPIALAGLLDAENYEAVLAYDPRFAKILSTSPWPHRPIRSISCESFLGSLASGSPVYDADTLRDYVREDLDLLADVRPEIVVGDFRLSLAVSARIANVPYMALTNACWSPYADQQIPLGEHPLRKLVGVAGAQSLFRMVRPIALAYHCRPLNRVRQDFGMPTLGSDLRKVFTEGDYTLYADIPDLLPTSGLPANHHYLGALLWSPVAALPVWWKGLRDDRPLLYVTLGSSGRSDLLAPMLEALSVLPVQVVAATAGRATVRPVPDNARVAEFLPGELAARRSQLVICNGGSPTTHQALCAGVPVLGIASNMNQLLNMEGICRAGAGRVLRAADASPDAVVSAVRVMMADPGYATAARRLAQRFAAYDPGARFRELVSRIPRAGSAVA